MRNEVFELRQRSMTILSVLVVSAGGVFACLPAAGAQDKTNIATSYTFKTIHKFNGSPDAANTYAGLTQGSDGNLYGVSVRGGTDANCSDGLGAGCGAIFRIDQTGKEKVIYSFVQPPPGAFDTFGDLLSAGKGIFYDMSSLGGNVSSCYQGTLEGCGTVLKFKLDKDSGKVHVLYNFQGPGTNDGQWPWGGLVQDASGNLYGDTQNAGEYQQGNVVELSPNGTETILHQFTGGSDGGSPGHYPLLDAAGNLYGVTSAGGGACGCGTVFKIAPDGSYTVLYTFTGEDDGGIPAFNLMLDSSGNLYGTTSFYGKYGDGVVFRLDPNGKETVLHAFKAFPDGAVPAGLTMDANGNIFGTTGYGGDSNCDSGSGCGIVYELSTSGKGKERILHTFEGTDGQESVGRLYIDNSGNLFGTTPTGGGGTCTNGCGTVYELSPGSR
jgi:uncharacterized repeat protein (TIGR03803 family)